MGFFSITRSSAWFLALKYDIFFLKTTNFFYIYKIFSKNKAHFIIALQPTAILMTETLAHKTQILYEMDISLIIMKLDILPGSFVIESGTGSGSLTYSICNVIQSNGHLFTFEFNKDRYENALTVFKKLKKDNVTVLLRDSCGEGFLPKSEDSYKLGKIDAVFLDLPRPWEAILHAKKVLRSGGKICCFSPCIEQVQKTHETLRENNFFEIEMVESLCRNFEKKERMVEMMGEEHKIEENLNGDGDLIEGKPEIKEEIEETIKEKETNENNNKNKPLELDEKIQAMKKENKTNNKRKRRAEKTNSTIKKTFFSTGQVSSKGHTGYLTFATYGGL